MNEIEMINAELHRREYLDRYQDEFGDVDLAIVITAPLQPVFARCNNCHAIQGYGNKNCIQCGSEMGDAQ